MFSLADLFDYTKSDPSLCLFFRGFQQFLFIDWLKLMNNVDYNAAVRKLCELCRCPLLEYAGTVIAELL